MFKLLFLAGVGLSLLVVAVPGQAWTPPPHPDVDSRIYIDGKNATADRITVDAPYNFGINSDREWNQIVELATWACGLYRRVPVNVSYRVSNAACDRMGSAAAERDPDCMHYHEFLCAIPPTNP